MPNTCVYNPKKCLNKNKKSLHKNNKKCYTKGNNCEKQDNKTKKVIIKLDDKDYLKKFGYSTKLAKEQRHKVLLKAVAQYGYSSVLKRLVALRTLTKNTQPIKSNKYNNDIIGLQKWKKYMEHMMKGGSKNKLTKINKLIKNILEIEKKVKK
jgi:hypothetical protein